MWLTSVSIRRPVFIWMVVSALLVLGLSSVGKMRLELNPQVEIPTVGVTTVYPGAGPEEVETQITKKIEDAVASVNGVKDITSSSQEGQSVVSISFNYGISTDVAAADVREKVSAIRQALPTEAKEPVVSKFDFNARPVLYYSLIGNRPSRDLRDMADNIIKQRLAKVNGVGAVSITGGDVREIQVNLKKERLEAYGISLAQVIALLQGQNLNFPLGRVTEGGREYAVRVLGEYKNGSEILNQQVRLPNGQVIRVKDVATVRDGVEERRDLARTDRADSVAIIIQKTSEGNTVQVAQGVKKEVMALQKELPPDVKFVMNQDTSINVEDNVHDVRTSLFLGAFLAVVVVFAFLHNIRGTFIVAIAIPTSIVASFLPMYSLGFTLNGMTLLALSLAVGILVDDSIVVLENIYRHLSRGEEPIEASLNGRGEIGLAAVTITMVDVVVFVPIAFMGGVTGQFFRPFGITVAVATLFSLFMSFTLTPMLASRWYRSGEGREVETGVFGLVNRFYSWLDRLYRGVLGWALRYRGVIVYTSTSLLILVFFAIAASVAGKGMASAVPKMAVVFAIFGLMLNWRYKVVGLLVTAAGTAAVFATFAFASGYGKPLLLFRFAPDQDQGQISVVGELPAGVTLDRTIDVVKQIEEVVATIPDIQSTFVAIGKTEGGMNSLGNFGPQYFGMSLKLREKVSLGDAFNPLADTKGKRKRADTDVADELRAKVGQMPDVNLKIAAVTGFEGGGAPLKVDLQGRDVGELTRLAEKTLQIFREEPGVINADLTSRLGKPEQHIVIDRDKAAQFGLTIGTVAQAVRVALEGDDTLLFRDNGNEYKIRVRYDEPYRRDTTEIRQMVVGNAPGPNGTSFPVRLGDLATIRLAAGPTKIDRLNRQRLVSVTGYVAPGFSPGNMQIGIDKKLKQLPLGTNSLEWGGENKVQAEEGQYMGAALGLAIILVYMLMAALFDSLITPLIIMVSLPQAMVGALLGLIAFGHSLTIVSMIGIIMLVGLVTKNAILLVDYTNTLRERGLSRTEAILEAGPTRLRPILMTTIAMIAGMLPTALGIGRGAEFRAPLASPVIGGLVLSTLLTLLVIPCVYTYFDDFTRFINRRVLRRRVVDETALPKEPAAMGAASH
jgi:HAE1 family hydrophobic/amphiphilic exporter-1